MAYIFFTLVVAAVFIVLVLLLAAKPKLSKAFTFAAFGVGSIGGLSIYGYGYAMVTDNFILAVLKAVLAVCGSFLGNNEYESIASAPYMQAQWMQILCAFVRLCALYATASAVITAVGAQALKRLRLWLGYRTPLHLIFGTNDNALHFGKELIAHQRGIVVFVSRQPDTAAIATIDDLGCVLQSDASATSADKRFLRRIGFGKGKRAIALYALDEDSSENIQYATSLLNTLREMEVPAERTSLVLMAQEEIAVSWLQQTPGKYGYGFVSAVNEPQMAARLLTTKYPPCNVVDFDAEGKATNHFEALLVGFGQVGQAVLRAIVMNAQFEGSHFKLDVFAQNVNSIDGNFISQYDNLLKEYDIHFYDQDARSRCMYEYLKQRASTLRYIVIATGSEKNNHEIAEELIAFLNNIGRKIPIYKCSRQSVAAYQSDGTIGSVQSVYSADLLCSHILDQKAMLLNQKYQSPTDKTPLQSWMECDYFSRQSCRAAADFIPAVLRAAQKSEQQVIDGDWELSPAQIENLSRTEHLRWCAFHYCMGFSAMDDGEFSERAEAYCQQKAQGGKPTIRISKNIIGRTHACLIPWEALDALSAKESALLGRNIDYKAMDTDNIMTIPQLLQADEEC